MALRTGICVLVMAASVAFAQESPKATIDQMGRTVKGIGKANEQRREKAAEQLGLSNKPGQSAPSATKSASAPAKTAPVNKNVAPQKTKSAKVAKKAGPAEKKDSTPAVAEGAGKAEGQESATVKVRKGQRDPFQTVIRSENVELGCASGKKCLVVSRISLKGIVRSQAGMIAVVENDQRKSYFLHENDPVFNGHVVRISADSVVFQERVVDRAGRSSIREVVKRLSATPVA